MTTFVGLDLGKTKGVACEVNEQGDVIQRFPFSMNRESLLKLSRKVDPQAPMALEVSTNSYVVSQILMEQGRTVSVSNPVLTKAIASSKIKNDSVDAETLAELLRCNYLPTVWVPDHHTQELRHLVSHRALLQKIANHLKNKLHSMLHRNLIAVPEKMTLFSAAGKAWLCGLPLSPMDQLQITTSLSLLANVEEQKAPVENELAKQAYQEKDVPLLLTIPGVDFLAAIALISAIGNVTRFKSPKKLANYFGLVPSLYESGKTSYKGSITKRGSGKVRAMLIQCANAAVKTDHPIRIFYERLKKKKGHPIAVTAVARKLVVILWHMLTSQKPYAFEKPKLTQKKLAKLHFLATGEKLKKEVKREKMSRREPFKPSTPPNQKEKEARLKV